MTDQSIYEAEQEYKTFLTLVNTKEYLTKDEYDFIIAYDKTEKDNFFYIGGFNQLGDYLNLNIYSEHDHEKHQYEMETGI